jgi:hypothetical protein
LEFANPTGSPLEFGVSVFPEGPTPCGFPVCPFFSESLPPHGTLSISFRPFFDDFPLNMIFVTPAEGFPLPTVTARITNGERPQQGGELPVIRVSTLLAANPTMLTFSGITRSATTHSNLALGSIDQNGFSQKLTVQVSVYSSGGNLLGKGVFSNFFQNQGSELAANILFVGDVAGQLGITDLDGGQIVVQKLSGGALWGEVATISGDGTFSMRVGLNP